MQLIRAPVSAVRVCAVVFDVKGCDFVKCADLWVACATRAEVDGRHTGSTGARPESTCVFTYFRCYGGSVSWARRDSSVAKLRGSTKVTSTTDKFIFCLVCLTRFFVATVLA